LEFIFFGKVEVIPLLMEPSAPRCSAQFSVVSVSTDLSATGQGSLQAELLQEMIFSRPPDRRQRQTGIETGRQAAVIQKPNQQSELVH
jgi:hypothetical protein